ncbi:hypothetical protein ACVD1N_05920 [Vibrio parahaemolyticus]
MKKLCVIALVSAQALAHSQVPVKYDTRVYTDTKNFSFDVTNKNEYPTGFTISVADYDLDTKSMSNEKTLGDIRIVQPNQKYTFKVRLKAPKGQTTTKVVCSSVNNTDVSYKSKICSLVKMEHR